MPERKTILPPHPTLCVGGPVIMLTPNAISVQYFAAIRCCTNPMFFGELSKICIIVRLTSVRKNI